MYSERECFEDRIAELTEENRKLRESNKEILKMLMRIITKRNHE